MESLMRFALLFLFLIIFSSPVKADIVFSINPRAVATYTVGDKAVFDIRIATDFATVNEVAGVSFWLGLDDPNFDGNITTGGLFTRGVHDSNDVLGIGRTYLFPRTELNVGQSLNISNRLMTFSTSTTVNRSVTQSGSLLGTVEVDLSNATLGSHTMYIGQLDVTNASFNPLSDTLRGNPFNYTVTAVPEPSSLFMVLTALIGLKVLCKRRRSSHALPAPANQ